MAEIQMSVSLLGGCVEETATSAMWHLNFLGRHFDVHIDKKTNEILGGNVRSRPRPIQMRPLPASVVTAFVEGCVDKIPAS